MTTTINQTITMTEQLGALISEHGLSQVSAKGGRWSNIIFIIFGVIALGGALAAAVVGAGATIIGFCAGVGLLALGGGLWSLYAQRREQDLTVRVYQEGLAYRRNGQTTSMRWDEIDDMGVVVIYNQQLRSAFYTYTLKDSSGQKIRLNLTRGKFENAEQLAQTIQQEVTRRQLAQAIADYRQGTPVQFGPLTVTQEGIKHGRKTLPWAQVAEVAIGRRGYFVVRSARQSTNWARVDMTKMSNVFTFIALVNWIIEQDK